MVYAWTGSGVFSPANTANTTWTAPAPTRDQRTFTLTLTVTEDTETDDATVTVTVPANQAPTVTGLPTSEEVDGSAELRINATASDPDDDTLMFTWTDQFVIGQFDDSSVLNTVWTAPAPQRHPQDTVLILTVADSVGDVTRRVNVQVSGNFAPLVRGGIFEESATDVFFGNTPVHLDQHTVADSDNLTYEWSSTGDLGSFDSPMSEHTIWTTPQATLDPQTVTLTLTVTDAIGATTFSKDVIVDGNHPPGVTLHNTPEDVDGEATVQLSAAVTNIESDLLTYQWSATDGTLADDTQLNTVWTAPAAQRTPTVVTLTLTVSDDGAGPGMTTKTATITVLADAEPTGRVTADTTTVYGGKEVTLMAAINDDGRSDVTYQWTATPDVGNFAASNLASTTWTAPDATDMQQSVTLTLRVADALGHIDIPTTVTVHENKPPTVTLGDGRIVDGGDMVDLAPTVADPEGDMLVYAWTADPDSGTFAGADAASTSWTAPAATRDARVVVLTLTVTDDGAGSLQGFDTVTFTVRPLDTEDLDDARSAPSFMSRHEGIQAGPLRDELQWLFPRRVPYTDYAAIGFDGFEVQSRSRGPGEDWLRWLLLDRVAADDIERAPASRVRYAIAPAPDCWDREWRVRALYSPAEGITTEYQDSKWLYARDYNRPPDNPTPHTPRIDADNTGMWRTDDGYELQLAWGLGGRPSDQKCADDTDYTYEVQRRYIIGKYWGSGEPQAAGEAHPWDLYKDNPAPGWWDDDTHGAFSEANWNSMWFNQPEELWSRLYRGIRNTIDDKVNTALVDCGAAPGGIDLFWNPTMVRDGNDIYSEWEPLPVPLGVVSVTEDNLTCDDPPTDIEYAVSVYYYQYRVRAHSGGKTSAWAEHRFTSHDLDREPPADDDAAPVS